MGSKVEFAAQTLKLFTTLFIQLVKVCEEEEVFLAKKMHCFDLHENEWHIAIMQIYENLYREDLDDRNNRGELNFDREGNVIEPPADSPLANIPTMSGAIRPFVEYIDGYRRRVAAPMNTLIREKYSKYADLDYI